MDHPLSFSQGRTTYMKITRIETLVADLGHRNSVLIRTHTDEGIYGVGEAYPVGPDMATPVWVDYFSDQLIGQDPRRIEHLWALMYQGARFPLGSSGLSALSGIDQSLWDILGKSSDLPVHKLLGGRVRDRVPVYLDIHWDNPDDRQQVIVQKALSDGFTAFKTAPLRANWRDVLWGTALEQGQKDMAELRELVGPDVQIGLDAHAQQLEASKALQLANIMAEYNPWFIEEPLRMENRHVMAELRKKMPVPLATGECLYTKFEFDELILASAVDIVQPDICICGGMTEMRKIAAIAEAHDVVVAPHNPTGPLATVVNIHFAAAMSNFLVLEYSPHSEAEMSMIEGAQTPVDGFFEIPDKPGWGVDIVNDVVQAHPYREAWHRSDRVNPDGSVAYI